jgi:hypothetical protein
LRVWTVLKASVDLTIELIRHHPKVPTQAVDAIKSWVLFNGKCVSLNLRKVLCSDLHFGGLQFDYKVLNIVLSDADVERAKA